MAAIFEIFADVAGDDIITRVCGAVVETAVTRLVGKKLPAHNAAGLVGGIVTAAGFPEFGIPITVAGHLLDRWLAHGTRDAGTDTAPRAAH